MRSTFKILFYINKNKVKTNGTTTILCRITIDGANVVIITGESIVPHDWSVKRGETSDKKVNQRLVRVKVRIATIEVPTSSSIPLCKLVAKRIFP